MDTDLSPEETARAIKEAQAKGLPHGWSVKLDKRRRRKWIAPNGKSCDSIPKAIAISIEIGLLPPDTPIPITSKKRAASKDPPGGAAKKHSAAKLATTSAKSPLAHKSSSSSSISKQSSSSKISGSKVVSSSSQKVEVIEPIDDVESDPEESLNPTTAPTVHWDPKMGKLVGWRIRVWDTKAWREGRIILYDTYTNKHKVRMNSRLPFLDNHQSIWLRLIHETVQYATRLVWAHVKGFAWWPAMVMDGDALDGVSQKKGHVLVNFFVTNEVSSLKDTEESIRPFGGGKVDEVIIKHKKKRNSQAIQVGRQEGAKVVEVRNQACRHYAKKAFGVANHRGNHLLGRRIEIHRDDVNYPYGDTLVGNVKQYSPSNRKWLVSFDMSSKTRNKYLATWMNLGNKDAGYKVLDKKRVSEPKETDLLPFLFGFQCVPVKEKDDPRGDELTSKLISERCWGCVDYLLPDQEKLTCSKCVGTFHSGCVEPDFVPTTRNTSNWICHRCTPCKGCWQHDVAFGSHLFSCSDKSKQFTLPEGGSPMLCYLCTSLYERNQYCPNCCHTWDDLRYQRVHTRSYTSPFMKTAGRGRKRKNSEDEFEEIEMDPSVPVEADWYNPDTSVWGYTAGNMLGCDQCGLWVHSGCSGLSRDDYDRTSSGKHKIYSKEFLCRTCCRQRSKELVEDLQRQDKMMLFAIPVTEDVAPTYHDIIKKPMDLQTMFEKAMSHDYQNYAWIREDFELMCLNALTFNRFHSKFWNEAKRFFHDCMDKVFAVKGKGAPPGLYKGLVNECFRQAEKEKKQEEERVQQDDTAEKKDLVAGNQVAKITLPPLRKGPVDQASCVAFAEVKLKPVEAHYCAWMDSCFNCGSSGAADTMLFCVDCGEAFHPFCVNAPIHSMDAASVSAWRCPNCKICEISGEVPQDETKMIFCEMCDRAFTTSLLDPPLQSAPEGLWICGQCVDCADCKNQSEKKGISVKYWSRDPEKCYRCGGCKGLVEQHVAKLKCSTCAGVLRPDDEDVVQCTECDLHVHTDCDPIAAKFMREKYYGTRGGAEKFECGDCRGKVTPVTEDVEMVRKHLHSQAWNSLAFDNMTPDPELETSPQEQYARLCAEIDWKMREMWSDEYMSVIQDGFTMITAIRRRDLDPRSMILNCLNGTTDVPQWIGHRAARFLAFAEKSGWHVDLLPVKNMQSAQAIARMAAAYLRVNCDAFQLQESIEVRAHPRMLILLGEPLSCGLVDIPIDPIRAEGFLGMVEQDAIPGIEASGIDQQAAAEEADGTKTRAPPDSVDYINAQPLIGWNKHLDESDKENEWGDPRACCLCRTSGDDDGDNERQVTQGLTLARCGRLLPMDGLWVHASCALWSSEVYEAQSGGLVHSMDKARSRGSQLKCFGCGRPGASVGCFKPNCNRNYHFPCAKACGAVFTTTQQVFCEAHKGSATALLPTESVEHMKTLMIAGKDSSNTPDNSMALRIGALTVHSMGQIEQTADGFHSEKYVTPPGYVATRIFWSTKYPRSRTLYVLKVEKDKTGGALFTVTPGDDPSSAIRGRSLSEAYATLTQRVKNINREYFSSGNLYSKLPVKRKHTKKAYGLNGPQFFGFGLKTVRKAMECLDGTEALVAPLTEASPSYRFCYKQPELDTVMALQRKRAAVAAENALENSSGSARTEGMKAVTRSTGSGRITRALVRNAGVEEKRAGDSEEKVKADRESYQEKYKTMKAVPLEDRLVARRSHIHGWGLFCKVDMPKDSMIVEYMGEVVRQCVADKREKAYEKAGVGSCYMFRLDLQRIVDATAIGSMARFMNHCCTSNAYAKVVVVDSQGMEKKIIVFANRDIAAGEEITYDYKFPVEDGSLKCTCGAPNCIGRMN